VRLFDLQSESDCCASCMRHLLFTLVAQTCRSLLSSAGPSRCYLLPVARWLVVMRWRVQRAHCSVDMEVRNRTTNPDPRVQTLHTARIFVTR